MSDSDYQTSDPDVAIERALNTHVGDQIDELVDPEIALTAVHVPGTPLERASDRDASAAAHQEAVECAVDTVAAAAALDKEYAGIDTRTAEGNYATRSNIVRD